MLAPVGAAIVDGEQQDQRGNDFYSEGVEQTVSVTKNLTAEQVKQWDEQDLPKGWVEKQLGMYLDKINQGGKFVESNKQLLPRKDLMEKILELWDK
jgi:hypothetical protein